MKKKFFAHFAAILKLLHSSISSHTNGFKAIATSLGGECSKKSVQQDRSPFCARSVHPVREPRKMARTPLAAFFNIPILCCIATFSCSDPREPWDLHTDKGRSFIEQGKFSEAEQELQSALQLAQQFGEQDPRLMQSLTNLAILFNAKGEPDKAVDFLKQTIAIHKKGPESESFAASLSNLGALYVTQKQFGQAQPYFERALAMREQAQKPITAEIIRELENLGGLFVQQSQYDAAEPYLQRVVELTEQAHGKDAPELVEPLNNLALLFRAQTRYAKAEGLLQRALTIKEQQLGLANPHLLGSLNNLALLHSSAHEFGKAIPLLERMIAIAEEGFGKEHPRVAILLNQFAEIHRLQNQPEQAIPLVQRAINIIEKAEGPDHSSLTGPLNNLAVLYLQTGQYDQADALFQRVITLTESTLGKNHYQVERAIRNYVRLLRAMNRSEEATHYETRAEAIVAHNTPSTPDKE